MRIFLIISILFSVVGFGQRLPPHTTTVNIGDTETPVLIDDSSFYRNKTVKQKVDTLNVPIVTIKESMDFLMSFHKKIIAMKELNLIADREFNALVNELNRIVGILEKKKKLIK